MNPILRLLPHLLEVHRLIREAVLAACERHSVEELGQVEREEEGDTIYGIDVVGEEILVEYFRRHLAEETSLVLIAEGLPGGSLVLPPGRREEEAGWLIIADPIDGTRELMYQKRSAWILTGVAPNRGPGTCLQDIQLAVQSELPLLKQHLCDLLWACRGQGVEGVRLDRFSGQQRPLIPRPSRARTIAHGFSTVSRFFPGAREELAAIDEEIVTGALGPVQEGKAHCFEDQYISTGGQFYELMMGHDRFIADLRPLMEPWLSRRGLRLGICCHPYDVCTELIAREAGVIVTDPWGLPLASPLSLKPEVAWVGYANAHIRAQVEPLLQQALSKRLERTAG